MLVGKTIKSGERSIFIMIMKIGLPNRDYAANGWYFVTICTHDRQWFLVMHAIAGEMQLSVIGKVAQRFWTEIPSHFKHTQVEAYVLPGLRA